MYEIYAHTHKGMVRNENQDNFVVNTYNQLSAYAVVCDGMGGMDLGKMASQFAVQVIEKIISKYVKNYSSGQSPYLSLLSALTTANAKIYKMASMQNGIKMGTTADAVIFTQDQAHIGHVGDGRVYLISKGSINRMTTDHSLVQEMVDNGNLTLKEAEKHPKKNIITRALGINDDVEIDYIVKALEKGDKILICSDGLTNYVTDNQINKIVNSLSVEESVNKLISIANKNGGGDNITVALARYC